VEQVAVRMRTHLLERRDDLVIREPVELPGREASGGSGRQAPPRALRRRRAHAKAHSSRYSPAGTRASTRPPVTRRSEGSRPPCDSASTTPAAPAGAGKRSVSASPP